MNKIKNNIIIFISLLILCSGFVGCGAQGKEEIIPELVFTYAENQKEDYPTTKGAYKFAELVDKNSNGRIKIVVQSDGELGSESSIVTQMGFGGVDFSRVSISTLAEEAEELRVLMMPCLYSSEEAMWKVLDGSMGEHFINVINEDNKGITALSWYDGGSRNFYSVKPIKSIEDIKGLNIRVQESQLMSDIISALGANPVKVNYEDVLQALKSGKIDGAENNWPSILYSEHFRAAKYCLTDQHIRIPEVQIVSDSVWNKLSESDKTLIMECAKESASYERQLWKKSESEALERISSMGVEVNEISNNDRALMEEAFSPLYSKYCNNYMDVINQIKAIN